MFQIASSLLKLKQLLFILKQAQSYRARTGWSMNSTPCPLSFRFLWPCRLMLMCLLLWTLCVQRPFGIKSNLVICYNWLWLLLWKCFRKLVHRDNIPPTPPDSWLCLFLPRLMISSFFWQTCPFFVFKILMEYAILLEKKINNNLGTCWSLRGEHLKIMSNLVICC